MPKKTKVWIVFPYLSNIFCSDHKFPFFVTTKTSSSTSRGACNFLRVWESFYKYVESGLVKVHISSTYITQNIMYLSCIFGLNICSLFPICSSGRELKINLFSISLNPLKLFCSLNVESKIQRIEYKEDILSEPNTVFSVI